VHREKAEHRQETGIDFAAAVVTFIQEADCELCGKGQVVVADRGQQLKGVQDKDIHLKAPEPHSHTKVQHWANRVADREAKDIDSQGGLTSKERALKEDTQVPEHLTKNISQVNIAEVF
jgi:hypothetical protein